MDSTRWAEFNVTFRPNNGHVPHCHSSAFAILDPTTIKLYPLFDLTLYRVLGSQFKSDFRYAMSVACKSDYNGIFVAFLGILCVIDVVRILVERLF